MAVDKQMSFDKWITYVFDRPVTDPEWYFDLDNDDYLPQSAEDIAYLTRTFEDCDTVLSSFSDGQVNQGLRYLVNPSCSNIVWALKDTEVPLPDRLHCIAAMETLFDRCFARRCSPHLSHLINALPKGDAGREGVSPLNALCFDWWSVLPLHGVAKIDPDHPDGAQLDRAIIAVLQRILEVDSIACQESALFGLFEGFSMYYPNIYIAITDDFTERHLDLCEKFSPRVQECLFGW